MTTAGPRHYPSEYIPPAKAYYRTSEYLTPATAYYHHGQYPTTHGTRRPKPNQRPHARRPEPRAENVWQGHLVATTSEYVGTFLFLFLAYSGHITAVDQAGSKGENGANSAQTVLYISLSYGFSLLVVAWMLYRVSGGLFNPAVTLALAITGNLPPLRALLFIPAQLLGAISAAALVAAFCRGTSAPDAALSAAATIDITRTTLATNMDPVRGLFFEMLLTAVLVFAVLMLAVEKSRDTFIAPIGIGLCLFVVEIAGVYYTGGSVNPARSLGPCVAGASFEPYFWIYVVGPVLGALISSGYYGFAKALHYERANPGQDADHKETV